MNENFKITYNESPLTKREYFAAMAMLNIQNVMLRKSGLNQLIGLKSRHQTKSVHEAIALEAVEQANFLIEALNKTQTEENTDG